MEPAIAKRSKADKIGVTTVFSQNEGVSNDEPQLARQAASVLVGTSIAPWEFLPCGVKTGTQRASAVRGGARAPGQTENHEAEPSPARRCHLRVLGAPNRLHPHRPLRLHRSLEPPRARRGHNQASGVGAHSSTLLHLLHPPPPPPHSSTSSTLLLLLHTPPPSPSPPPPPQPACTCAPPLPSDLERGLQLRPPLPRCREALPHLPDGLPPRRLLVDDDGDLLRRHLLRCALARRPYAASPSPTSSPSPTRPSHTPRLQPHPQPQPQPHATCQAPHAARLAPERPQARPTASGSRWRSPSSPGYGGSTCARCT